MRLIAVCLLVAYTCSVADCISRSKRSSTPPDDGRFLCIGCVAVVKSTFAIDKRLTNEEKLQSLLEDDERICNARNFDDAEQREWNLPPPVTGRACKTFLQVCASGII
jgi:hypothetical protein